MSEIEKIKPADFVVKSKIKVLLKEADMNASAEMWDELGHHVTHAIKAAITRAQANKRKTVKACDL
jgi:hypothetical protein